MPGIGRIFSMGGTAAAVATDMAAKAAGTVSFQAQMAELTRVSLEATARSVALRTTTTALGSSKKVADEPVR